MTFFLQFYLWNKKRHFICLLKHQLMAEITSNDNSGKKGRLKRTVVRVDLTPMVDLAFLLISFFMLTVVMNEEKALKVNMPIADGTMSEVADCQVINLYADYDRVYYTEGLGNDSVKLLQHREPGSLKDVLAAKTAQINTGCFNTKGKPRDLVCIIKLLPDARYKAMVEIFDDMELYNVPVYAMQDFTPDEEAMIKEFRSSLMAQAGP